jgi:hypothetical protein
MKERTNDDEKVLKMTKKNEELKVRTGFELIEEYKLLPEPKVLWNGIIEGATGLFTGVGKTGKTTIAENLAIALACGKKEFYGYALDGIPRKVLFLNLEEKLWRIGRRHNAQISNLNDYEVSLFQKNYFVKPRGFSEYLLNSEDWLSLEKYILSIKPEVLFIDSLTHMCAGEIERSSIANDFIINFKKHIGYLDATTFVIHHNTKGNTGPMTQENIAGSRIITQEFDFALGFGNIPTAKGGSYSCMLYNKDAEKTNNRAITYEIDSNFRVKPIEEFNVYDLYKEVKIDGRKNDTNKKLVYDYVISKASKGSKSISYGELKKEFIENSTFTKPTLYSAINYIISKGSIKRSTEKKGHYTILDEGNNARK